MAKITTDQINITGTPDGTKFLRDDNSWAAPTASVAWGGITGTLSDQTDLQSALDAKQDSGSYITAPAAFQATGSTNITSTAVTLELSTEVFDPDSNYTLTSSEITCTLAGYYHVDINVPINDDGSAGGTRSRVFAYLEQDQTTSTWITVNNIRGQCYAREVSGGEGLHAAGIVLLQAGEVIRARIDQSGTVDTSTESAEVSLNIHRVRAT